MSAEEIDQTYEGIKVMLEDTEMFDTVCKEVFKAIDCDGNGDLDKDEIQGFIDWIQEEMGIAANPEDEEISQMYAALEDGGGDVTLDKLKNFLKTLFEAQIQ